MTQLLNPDSPPHTDACGDPCRHDNECPHGFSNLAGETCPLCGPIRCSHGFDVCGGVITDCCSTPRPICVTVNVAEAGNYCKDGYGCQAPGARRA